MLGKEDDCIFPSCFLMILTFIWIGILYFSLFDVSFFFYFSVAMDSFMVWLTWYLTWFIETGIVSKALLKGLRRWQTKGQFWVWLLCECFHGVFQAKFWCEGKWLHQFAVMRGFLLWKHNKEGAACSFPNFQRSREGEGDRKRKTGCGWKVWKTHVCVNECMNEWMNRWICKWMNGQITQWMTASQTGT